MIFKNRILKRRFNEEHSALEVWDTVDREAKNEGHAIQKLDGMRPDPKKYNVRNNKEQQQETGFFKSLKKSLKIRKLKKREEKHQRKLRHAKTK